MSAKLNPCPFCGSRGKLIVLPGFGEFSAAVVCMGMTCEIQGPGYSAKKKDDARSQAVDRWNRRHPKGGRP